MCTILIHIVFLWVLVVKNASNTSIYFNFSIAINIGYYIIILIVYILLIYEDIEMVFLNLQILREKQDTIFFTAYRSDNGRVDMSLKEVRAFVNGTKKNLKRY